jgi:hypothetical protein
MAVENEMTLVISGKHSPSGPNPGRTTLDPVQQALRTITACLVGTESDVQELERQLRAVISANEMEKLVRSLNANRVTTSLYQFLSDMDTQGANEVKSRLRSEVMDVNARKLHRDILLRTLGSVLDSSEIEYALFKTFNRAGAVGVDIDVMIALEDFDECVNALTGKGFYSIDNLSKRYATGFMVRGNPIIIDLHTELAVLGIRYLPSDFLLTNKKKVKFFPSDGSDWFSLSILDDAMDSVVRIAHSVIKEGTISVGDIVEILQPLRKERNLVMSCVEAESLQFSASIFLRAASAISRANEFVDPGLPRSFSYNLAERQMQNRLGQSHLPFKLPLSVSLLSLLDHLEGTGELVTYLPRLVSSLRFQRNTVRLGQKLIEHLGQRGS